MSCEQSKVQIFQEYCISSLWGKRIVLTNGFVKKSMKTPKSAVELAVKYKNDYIERYT